MSTAILIIIALLPISIIVMCFIVALGKRPGNRRRHQPDMLYEGPERRCKFRSSCPEGQHCREPADCAFSQARSKYADLLDLRNKNTKAGLSVE